MTDVMDIQYYSIDEVSKSLKVAYLTVYRWIKQGKLPSLRAGKQYRIKATDITKFMELRK